MKTLILLAFACPFLSGCIAWELRDELRTANGQLGETNAMLEHTAHRLAAIDGAIADTNSRLAGLHATLDLADQRIAQVNSSLGATAASADTPTEQTLMRIMTDVNGSLNEVHGALGPLGKSLGAVSSAASFLGLGGGDNVDLLEAEDQAPADAGAADAASGTTSPAADSGATKPASLLVGTWLLVYPPPTAQQGTKAFVLSADGTFIEAQPGQPLIRGTWKRDGRSLTTTPEPGRGGATAQPATADLITLTSRTLTLRRGDEIKVYARP